MESPGSSKWSRAASRSHNTGGCAGSKMGPAGRQRAHTVHVSGQCNRHSSGSAHSSREGSGRQLQSSRRTKRQLCSSTLLNAHTPAAGSSAPSRPPPSRQRHPSLPYKATPAVAARSSSHQHGPAIDIVPVKALGQLLQRQLRRRLVVERQLLGRQVLAHPLAARRSRRVHRAAQKQQRQRGGGGGGGGGGRLPVAARHRVLRQIRGIVLRIGGWKEAPWAHEGGPCAPGHRGSGGKLLEELLPHRAPDASLWQSSAACDSAPWPGFLASASKPHHDCPDCKIGHTNGRAARWSAMLLSGPPAFVQCGLGAAETTRSRHRFTAVQCLGRLTSESSVFPA